MRDFKRLAPFIRPYWWLLGLALLCLFTSAALEGAIMVLLEPIFNVWRAGDASAAAEGTFGGVARTLGLTENPHLKIPAFMILFALVKGVFLYGAEYSMSYVGLRVVAALRSRVHGHLLSQSMSFYLQNPTGQLMSRVITDTERIQQTVSRTLADSARQLILLVVFVGILLAIDWKLTLATFLIGPPVAWITMKLGNKLRGVALRSQQSLADISQTLQETIAGQRIVKAFAMERYEQDRFEARQKKLIADNLRVARINALNTPIIEMIGYIAFAPLLVYANYLIFGQGSGGAVLTLGSLALFVTSLIRLYDPVRKLSRIHLQFQQAFASSTRVFELIDTPIDVRANPHAAEIDPLEREIRFDKVTLYYPNNKEKPALDNVDLVIRQGETVALVGASGAGKSSLAGLIPRFYDASSGRVTIDDVDVRDVSLRSLRRQIAIVTQDTFLFNDTIRANISYGRPDRPVQEIEAAARAAYIYDFIVGLPSGFETPIGELGQQLSGGQRQRLAIARAALKQAPILILDEATSSLDSESENLVQKALYNLMRDCTTIVIAHRLSTVREADRIVVLHQGRIAQIGRHKGLMEQSGIYRDLYRLQFQDDFAEVAER